VTEAKPLERLIHRVSEYVAVGNGKSENTIKTLSHDLHSTHRRSQEMTTMLIAARHRPQFYPMSGADYTWAAARERKRLEQRRAAKAAPAVKLQLVSLESSTPLVADPFSDDELQEEEAEEDDKDEGVSTDAQYLAGWALDEKVKITDIRRVLSPDTIIECLWSWSAIGEPEARRHPSEYRV
jgi:hypothetical protein